MLSNSFNVDKTQNGKIAELTVSKDSDKIYTDKIRTTVEMNLLKSNAFLKPISNN